MRLDIIAFTVRGAALAEKILMMYPDSEAAAPQRYCNGAVKPMENDLAGWTEIHFKTGKTLVFIGAAGIAVRAVAPFLKSKLNDAAVICVDERGNYVIPLLSGHIGGANRAAKQLANALGARAVITTATDSRGHFAVDAWAAENNCMIADSSMIKRISAALLDGEAVGFRSEFPVVGELPAGISCNADAEYGIEIAFTSVNPFPITLHMIPRVIVAGIGCRKGISADMLEHRLRGELSRIGVPIEAVGIVASIDIKAEEQGLIRLCEMLNAEFTTFSAKELMSAEGEFAKSDMALRITGADNVCERAVVCAGGKIITGKSPADGVTVALGRLDWNVSFEEALI